MIPMRNYTILVLYAVSLSCGLELQAQVPQHLAKHHAVRRAHAHAAKAMEAAGAAEEPDPAEVTIGERLFLETRFAQYFATHSNGNVNAPLEKGDPTVQQVETQTGTQPGPFAGQSMNCRSCHFVDEFTGNRTYADFANRSPIPDRGDGHATTSRNSLNMVDSFVARPIGILLHGDGEFGSEQSLVKSTFTGRNFGWRPTEYSQAVAQMAKVIREDNGSGALAQQYGGAYSKILLGTASDIPVDFRLPAAFRLDVTTATDEQIFEDVAKLVSAYLDSLAFARDEDDVHNGSPYDAFLEKNDLPTAPASTETDVQYSQRLLRAIRLMASPKYVTASDGAFQYHNQQFVFGPLELKGLKLFLQQSTPSESAAVTHHGLQYLAVILPCAGLVGVGLGGLRKRRFGLASICLCSCLGLVMAACGTQSSRSSDGTAQAQEISHVGNCVTCHTAPNFTDFSFHNTGATQDEYDAVHGNGAFAAMEIPGYTQRSQLYDAYLPANPTHPNASERFRSIPSSGDPGLADLGLWNIYANSDYPEPQKQLQRILCKVSTCDPEKTLPLAIGRFKTPTLRDLGQSGPYLHSGRMKTIEDVLTFYQKVSALSRKGTLRNSDTAIAGISIDNDDAAALAAFLHALNEDYD